MPRPPQLCPAATLVNLPTPRKRGQDGSPRGKDTSFSPIPASTAGLTWRGYRSRGQTYGAGVPRERGSHVSNLQMGLVYLAAQETDGGGLLWGERTLHLKGPHLEVSWAPEGEVPVPPRPCSSPALLRSHPTPPWHPDTSGPLHTSPHPGSRTPTPLLPPGPHPACSQGDIPQAPREYSQGRRGWWICSPVFSDSSSQTRPLASRDRLGSGSLKGDPTPPGEWGREPVTGAGGC